MPWIDDVLESTKDAESPERYFYWSALAAISAVVRKNVYLNKFIYILYPNIFVILVSERSGLRKGIPLGIATNLVLETDCTKVIGGQNSFQSIIHDLALQYTTDRGAVLNEGQCFLTATEFSSFLLEDDKALVTLTDLYDTHAHEKTWRRGLKSGPETLKNPCITMLAASNETLFSTIVTPRDIDGGFLARTFIVYESKKRLSNPLTRPPERKFSLKDLSSYLHEIKGVKGEFKYSPQGLLLYEKWYSDFESRQSRDKTGTLDRTHDQVLKVAMLISLSRRTSLVLEEEDIQEALDRVLECIHGAKKVSEGSGKSEMAFQTKMILRDLANASEHKMERRKILSRHYGDLDCFDLDRVIETLSQAGVVESHKGPGKVGLIYEMSHDALEQYSKFFEEEETTT